MGGDGEGGSHGGSEGGHNGGDGGRHGGEGGTGGEGGGGNDGGEGGDGGEGDMEASREALVVARGALAAKEAPVVAKVVWVEMVALTEEQAES